MGDFKSRVRQAVENFHKRELKSSSPPSRKNNRPEKQVESNCLHWMRQMDWSVEIFESKATYNPNIGVYKQQSMKQGTPDCIGCDAEGAFVAVEFKAPGRKSTLRPLQRKYLMEKIEHGAFAVCVDSAESLAEHYRQWCDLARDPKSRKEFLLLLLPSQKSKNHSSLFED